MTSTEGWVWEVKSKNLHRKIAPRYLVLQGKHFLLYREKPETGKEEARKFGTLCSETRVEDQGREKVKGHALYIFKIYMPSRSSKGIKLGVSTPEDQAKWIGAALSHINGVVGERASPEEHFGDRSQGAVSSDSDSLHSQDGATPGVQRYHSIGPKGCPSLFSDMSEEPRGLHWQDPLDADDNNGTCSDLETDWQFLNDDNGVRFYKYSKDRSDRNSTAGKQRGGARIMKAVSIVEAATEDIFTEIMDLGPSRRRWDTTFRAGSVVEMTDGHTDVIHEVLQKLWNKKPRDFCLLRYWRRRESGSYEIYLCSTHHPACPPRSQCVRAKLISSGFVISPLKAVPGTRVPRSLVEHTIEMDSQGWSGLLRKISNHHHKLKCLMLKRVAGLQDLFHTRRGELPAGADLCDDDDGSWPRRRPMRLPVPDLSAPGSAARYLSLDGSENFQSCDAGAGGEGGGGEDDQEDDDDDGFFDCEEDVCCPVELDELARQDQRAPPPGAPSRTVAFKVTKLSVKLALGSRLKSAASTPSGSNESITLAGPSEHANGAVAPELNLSTISGSFTRVDLDAGRNGWNQPPGHLFNVRAEGYFQNKSKMVGGEPLLTAVAVDWYRSGSRMDNIVSQQRNPVRLAVEAASVGLSYQPLIFVVNLQIPGKTHHSAVAYYVCRKPMEVGSMLHRFVHGDDHFRNNRLKMIPRVHQGPWIVKQSVGDVACLLGKSLVITYHVGPNYMELDVDIGSSMVASGILRIALSYVNSYIIDLAFLVQVPSSSHPPHRRWYMGRYQYRGNSAWRRTGHVDYFDGYPVWIRRTTIHPTLKTEPNSKAELQAELPEEILGTLRIAKAELSAAVAYPYGDS